LIDKLRARLEATEAAIPTGQASVADAVGIRAEISAARADVEQAEGVEAAGRAALSRWIGEASRQPLAGGLPICRPPPQDAALAFLDRHRSSRSLGGRAG